MIARILAFGLLIAVACTGAEANACFVTGGILGPKPSRAEELASAKQWSAYRVRERILSARRSWAAGIDAPDILAEWLVPNVRPVPRQHSDCAPPKEVDLGDGEETWDDWLAGTPYAGRAVQYEEVLWNYEGPTPGPACNAEVRARFADHLRRRLTPDELRESYLFLAARRPDTNAVVRLTAFSSGTRRPPLRWSGADLWTDDQVRRWLRRHPAGRALNSASDQFWAETEPLLDDKARLCPAATAAWPAAQAALVREIEALKARYRAHMAGKPAS
ncbi:MAG TPA: hypothetical protein VFP12_00795 [Allosphingosinicella sp.]|nr:hypothetical protein [Allosphingosinicella sp.]